MDQQHLPNQTQVQFGRRVARRSVARFRTVGNDTFILNLQNGSLHYTNGVGTFIWQLIDGSRTIEELSCAVAEKFTVAPAVVRADVVDFVQGLSQKALVTLEGSTVCIPPAPYRNPDLLAQSTRLFAVAQQKCIPLTAFLMLTHACNLRCYYCYDAGRRSRIMTYARWSNILDQLAQAGTLFLRITGGEPTTHPDFTRIIEYAAQKGFSVAVITNGTLITPEMADQFNHLELDSVSMTFHGGSAAVHDRLAGRPGAFETTRHTVEMLLEHGVRVSISMVVSRRNYDDIDAFLRMLDAWGLPPNNTLTISVAARTNGSTDTWADRLSPDLIRHLMSRGLFKPFPIICNAATAKCVITPEGYVMPCHLFWAQVGDLNRKPFADIWSHSPALQQMRQEQWFLAPDECQACPAYNKYCHRCPAEVYFAEGHFRKKCAHDCQVVDLYMETLRAIAVPA